jgi:hypothetical protein
VLDVEMFGKPAVVSARSAHTTNAPPAPSVTADVGLAPIALHRRGRGWPSGTGIEFGADVLRVDASLRAVAAREGDDGAAPIGHDGG